MVRRYGFFMTCTDYPPARLYIAQVVERPVCLVPLNGGLACFIHPLTDKKQLRYLDVQPAEPANLLTDNIRSPKTLSQTTDGTTTHALNLHNPGLSTSGV